MPLSSTKDFVDAEENGQTAFHTWRKNPTQTTGAGIWFDLSMSPGNPIPNYYAAAPAEAKVLAQSTNGGIAHGGNVFPMVKHVKTLCAMTPNPTAVPITMTLCDYLLYYPFMDMSVTDPQPVDNTAALTRYADGRGVMIMPVLVASQSGVGNPQFNIQYTNQDGLAGQVTPVVTCNTQITNGTLVNTAPATARCAGPFIPLSGNDRGVQKIESVQFFTPDVGLIAFVLVRPIVGVNVRTIDAAAERVVWQDFAARPVIADDAYLNLICCPNGSLANTNFHGYLQTVFG